MVLDPWNVERLGLNFVLTTTITIWLDVINILQLIYVGIDFISFEKHKHGKVCKDSACNRPDSDSKRLWSKGKLFKTTIFNEYF